ncbi:IS21-like element helper ATPase IstB [Deinococcus sp. NW-56]|uniref:IS21-like element helper ATPase IstB n=1 Tax=Deinococcus sp. NW-56 TaxID=2080419 RepID=UPI000CF49697|nr:IS21-like element helper ATPase IstB [Deinococcus sp. NW-56]
MLPHPVIQHLRALKLDGMALALQEQQEQPDLRELSFEERLTLLVDRERACRDTRGLQRRLSAARLKVQASLEEVDTKHPRGLDARLLRSLAQGQWIAEKRGVIITGPTGVGKTFIGCALAHQACRQGFTALYAQTGRLLQELTLAKGDGRYLKLLASIARVNVLILDDWGLDVPTAEGRRILLEILDDRYERSSTIITSQFPTLAWHANLGDPTLADAILDRVLHNAYRIELRGESLRKKGRKLTPETVSLS